ncbi:MAG: type II toxin-antitoxin system Phd/YefM family antitoxin [Patescibacteria group bacterium]|mgnify:CR=1 FL=1
MAGLNLSLLPKFTSVSSLRYKTASLIRQLQEDKKPVILLRGSAAVGVIIPPEMYEHLVKLAEDTEDLDDALLSIKLYEKKAQEKGIPINKVAKELGITL